MDQHSPSKAQYNYFALLTEFTLRILGIIFMRPGTACPKTSKNLHDNSLEIFNTVVFTKTVTFDNL